MTNKETLEFYDLSKKALKACFDIQNKGIATVFFNLSGHCNCINIRLFEPVWYNGATASFDENISLDLGYVSGNENILNRLLAIASQDGIDEETQKQIAETAKNKAKRDLYEQLKKEFEKETA